MLEYRSRGRVSLISHPYDDSPAANLGTAILTILCFQDLLNNEQIHWLIGHTSALGDTNTYLATIIQVAGNTLMTGYRDINPLAKFIEK